MKTIALTAASAAAILALSACAEEPAATGEEINDEIEVGAGEPLTVDTDEVAMPADPMTEEIRENIEEDVQADMASQDR